MKRVLRVLFAVLLLAAFGQGAKGREAAAQEPKAPASPDPLEEFIPHEKVPADSAVAFPVDI